jgi:hypothetical protein
VYLDLHLSFNATSHARQLKLDALNDGVAGETTWNSLMSYAGRPDGTGSLPNGNTTTLATYNGRVMQANAGSGGPRNKENPPGQVAIVINPDDLQALIQADTNNELTLILYGTSASTDVSSLGSTNLHPQLRILRQENTAAVPESVYGGELHGLSWNTSGTTARVGEEPYNQILAFELPKQPAGGFKAEDTSLEVRLASHNINPGNWGLAQVDVWAIGYAPANAVPLSKTDLDSFLIQADTESKAGLNLGTNTTEKIYNNLVSPFSSSGRFAIPPEASSLLTSFINDLYLNHGVSHGDYLVLRLNPDVNADNSQVYNFNTGNASDALKPVLTLTAFPRGTVLTLK